MIISYATAISPPPQIAGYALGLLLNGFISMVRVSIGTVQKPKFITETHEKNGDVGSMLENNISGTVPETEGVGAVYLCCIFDIYYISDVFSYCFYCFPLVFALMAAFVSAAHTPVHLRLGPLHANRGRLDKTRQKECWIVQLTGSFQHPCLIQKNQRVL